MNSIDRKILRCQREIEAALPKGLSFEEFETGIHPGRLSGALYSYVSEDDCRQIKGAAQVLRSESVQTQANQGTTPEAAPPSVQKFKVGDRVRCVDELGHSIFYKAGDVGTVIPRIVGSQFIWVTFDNWRAAGSLEQCAVEPAHLVLLSPASETEAEGWIDFKGGGCPVAKTATVRVKCTTPWNPREAGEVDLSAASVCWESFRVVAYRVVKP